MSLPSDTLPDRYDRVWEEHVRPADWRNPNPEGPYNLVVIGAGAAGLISASLAAGLGARVALVLHALAARALVRTIAEHFVIAGGALGIPSRAGIVRLVAAFRTVAVPIGSGAGVSAA